MAHKWRTTFSSDSCNHRNTLIIKTASTRIRTKDLLITNRATHIVVVQIRSEPGQLGGICLVSFVPPRREWTRQPPVINLRSASSDWRTRKAMLSAILKARDDAPLDLLAGLSSSFAGSRIVPAGLLIRCRKMSPRLFKGRIRITLEVSNGPSYNSCSMRRVLKTANKPLEIKPQEKSVWICMCGLSKNQPYCDGLHKKVADEEDGKTYEYDSEGHRREVTT